MLKLMENSTAVCDNYQPAPEDGAEKKKQDGWRWRGEPEKKREIEVRGRWAHEESWEKELLLARVSSGDAILSAFSWLPPLWRSGCFFLVCQAQPPHHPLTSSTRPPSLESVIRPSWRGVKNIMWEGPPCKKRAQWNLFYLCRPLINTLLCSAPASNFNLTSSSLSYVHLQRKVACVSTLLRAREGDYFLLVGQTVIATSSRALAAYVHLLWDGLMRGQQKDLEGEETPLLTALALKPTIPFCSL